MRPLALILLASLAACSGERSSAAQYSDAGFVSDFSHPTNNPAATVATASRTANDPKICLDIKEAPFISSLPGNGGFARVNSHNLVEQMDFALHTNTGR